VTTRYQSTIGGDLALTITDNNVELAVSNPHGDIVATVPVTGNGAGQGITGWAQYDEYGNQLSEPVNTGATTYGWHGADQRAVDTSGLILMGARLYNSVTGLFTSRDPVEGGNTTSYAYPQDPVGMSDTTGEWGRFSSWRKREVSWGVRKAHSSIRWGKKQVRSYLRNRGRCAERGLKGIETVAGFAPGWSTAISIGAGFARAAVGHARGRRGSWKEFGLNTVGTLTFAGKGKLLMNLARREGVTKSIRRTERYIRYSGGFVRTAGNYGHRFKRKESAVTLSK